MALEILAILTDAGCVDQCLDGAVAAAGVDTETAVHALLIEVDPDHIVTSDEEVAVQRLRDVREGSAGKRADAIRAAFDAWKAAHPDAPVSCERIVGVVDDVLRERSGTADIIVLCRPDNMDGGDALHAAAFEIDKPLLIVPPAASIVALRHVMVAWSGSEACEKAVAAAMPWLRAAALVRVLRIGADPAAIDRLRDDPGLGGVSIEVCERSRDETISIGAQIAREAADAGADLIVAGAYRHGAIVEWLLGSTTRHLIDAATKPLFLAHAR
jgi:nucleotide-binding universal stress UspA family protein